MASQLTTNGEDLRLFFTDDIYLVDEPLKAHVKPMEVIENEEALKEDMPSGVSEPEIPLVKERMQFKFLGNNKKNILILVFDEQNDVSDEKGRELLRKIVKSVNLTAADFALVNYAQYIGTSFDELKTFFSSTVVFSFGVSPERLGLKNHSLNVMVTEGTVKLIFSSTLQKLDEDTNDKKALWGSLKQLEL